MGEAALTAPPHSNVVHGHVYSETLFTDVFIVVWPTVPEVIIDLLRDLLVHAWVFLGNFFTLGIAVELLHVHLRPAALRHAPSIWDALGLLPAKVPYGLVEFV
jgi:hypothetical protein